MAQSGPTLPALLAEIRDCAICAEHLPLGPRPVLRARETATLLIIGQAPGTKVHETGIPWNDPSGDRLRDWLQIDKETFYDENRIAIVPSGFCYPGRYPRGGDLPPRPECAPTWHPRVLAHLKNIELTLLVGSYAQQIYLKEKMARTLTETVKNWESYGAGIIPLPHPSWRTLRWQRDNPWFERDLLPVLRRRVRKCLESE